MIEILKITFFITFCIDFSLIFLYFLYKSDMRNLLKIITDNSNSDDEKIKRYQSKLIEEYNQLVYNINSVRYSLFIIPIVIFNVLLFLKEVIPC